MLFFVMSTLHSRRSSTCTLSKGLVELQVRAQYLKHAVCMIQNNNKSTAEAVLLYYTPTKFVCKICQFIRCDDNNCQDSEFYEIKGTSSQSISSFSKWDTNEFYFIIINHTNLQTFCHMELLSINKQNTKSCSTQQHSNPETTKRCPAKQRHHFIKLRNNSGCKRCNVNIPVQPDWDDRPGTAVMLKS
jgi:hypothetical protein